MASTGNDAVAPAAAVTLAGGVTTRGGPAACNARVASSMPIPQRPAYGRFGAHELRSGNGRALVVIALATIAAVAFGAFDLTNAATPTTCAAAALVPMRRTTAGPACVPGVQPPVLNGSVVHSRPVDQTTN